MSDHFAAAAGRKVVSRASAEELGTLTHIVVDAQHNTITSLVVGKGRNARLVAWTDVSGFGPDAIMLTDENALHEPRNDTEQNAADGKLDLLGKRVLNDMGNDQGTLTDITFDPTTGTLDTLTLTHHQQPATTLLATGTYATIIQTPPNQG